MSEDRAGREGGRSGPDGTTAALVLGIGLLLGLAADRLLWQGPLGPGMTLWMALLGSAAVLLARRQRWTWGRDVLAWSGVAVMAVAGTAWRASPVLNLLFLATAVVAASGAILAARGHRLGETRVRDHVWGLALVPWHAGTGAVSLLSGATLSAPWGGRRTAAVGRGVLLAIPPVVVFGLLFASADPVFERAAGALIPDIETLPLHIFLVGFFGWVGAGLLGGLFPHSARTPLDALQPPRLGVEETATALGLVAAVFLAFVAIQFSYLFGGAAAIQSASGLTVAEYARRGFFELVAVAGLVMVLLLAAHATVDRGGRRTFQWLAGLLVVLVMVIIASAWLRLRLYVDAFGLTDARYFASAIMVWIAAALLLFAATILRGRPGPFASGALGAGLLTVVILALLNPDAAVARTNVQRAVDAGTAVDAGYLASLSADAVPVIVPAVLDPATAMAPEERCELTATLIRRWAAAPEEDSGWRRWNAARAEARASVADRLRELEAAAGTCM